jgi:hypothetical protein
MVENGGAPGRFVSSEEIIDVKKITIGDEASPTQIYFLPNNIVALRKDNYAIVVDGEVTSSGDPGTGDYNVTIQSPGGESRIAVSQYGAVIFEHRPSEIVSGSIVEQETSRVSTVVANEVEVYTYEKLVKQADIEDPRTFEEAPFDITFKYLREIYAKKTQKAIALGIGIAASTLGRWEKGEKLPNKRHRFEDVARGFGWKEGDPGIIILEPKFKTAQSEQALMEQRGRDLKKRK